MGNAYSDSDDDSSGGFYYPMFRIVGGFDDFYGGGGRGRYANRAEKSTAASRREVEVRSNFDYLRSQMDLAVYENAATAIGLGCVHRGPDDPRGANASPLRLLPPDVLEHVLGYALVRPRGTADVRRAVAEKERTGTNAIVPLEGRRGGAPKKKKRGGGKGGGDGDDGAEAGGGGGTVTNLADASIFVPGAKIVIPLAEPNQHLTGPCYRGEFALL